MLIVLLAIVVIAFLIFLLYYLFSLDRVRNKSSKFPVSDGYRWECQEFDMNFECKMMDSGIKNFFRGEAVINGTLYEVGDDRVHTCTKTKGRMEFYVAYSGFANEFF